MRVIAGLILLTVVIGFSAKVEAKETIITGSMEKIFIHTRDESDSAATALALQGKDARQQILITAKYQTGFLEDVTRDVSFKTQPEGVVRVSSSGLVFPMANGETELIASTVGGMSAAMKISVKDFEQTAPVNFPNEIVPIFTKTGCNGGGCHGKSGGQNGFKLSLLGFEPTEDYEYLVKEARGRRIFPAAPERSLLLLKGAATLPHGGGKRIEEGSDDYQLLARWISQGMPYGNPTDPHVVKIEVFPKERTMKLGSSQQLVVYAHYSDGSSEDVTRGALFEPNDKNMAKCNESGVVTMFEQPGDVAVMIRYQAKVAVFRAALPLGHPVENLPPARNFVDTLVYKKLKALGLPPSGETDDSTFLRRSALDIAGRMPTMVESKAFLAETNIDKREKWIDSLLDSAEYGEFFANKWSSLLRNKRGDASHIRGNFAFYDWMRDSFIENKPYDQFVKEIVAASGDIAQNPSVAWYRQANTATTQLEDSAQLFLGLRLQCAQCHHHPFEKWSQEDYYSLSAVFSTVAKKKGSQPGEEIVVHRRAEASATNQKTKKPVKAAALGTTFANLTVDEDPRVAYAEWMANPANPFFAKSLVNRYWKHFMGRGLVDPEDDMRETNPPTNPELLDALAKHFVESGFDLKDLVRTITTSRIYQLEAAPNQHNILDKQHFSRYYPKRLTAEVLFDAVHQTVGVPAKFDGLPAGIRAVALPDNSYNSKSYFLTVFGRPEASSSCECERSQDASLAQSLHLLNSKELQDKLSSDAGRAAKYAADTRSDQEKMTELYYLAFSRPPTEQELKVGLEHINKKATAAQAAGKRQAYEDILWALINTKEFLFNH
ncbi:MAG: DUF1549 and DUF1553 domain-containing protein [Verrucomicrobiales bacterium]